MLIETKLAIQDKTQVFSAGRIQYIVAVESNQWRQRFFRPLRKIYFRCLFMSRLNDIFQWQAHLLICTKSLLVTILFVSKPLICENSDVSSGNILHIDFKLSGKSCI